MKRKTTKEILADSFLEISERKNINKITIQDIVSNCGYSPATFYRHFKDKYDLIAWNHTRSVAQIMDRLDKDSYKWNQTLLDTANWFYEQREYLKNLLWHTSGYDSFMHHMVEIHYTALEKYISSVIGDPKLDLKEKLLTRIYCLGAVSLTCEWILGQHTATPDEIADVYEDALPEPLKKYLV